MKKNSLCILLLILLFSFCLYGCSNGGFLIGTQYIEKNMYVGEKILLQANITEQDGNTIVWESSDPEVATVDQNGLVVALAEGYVNIIATLGDETCIAHIKIEAKEQKEQPKNFKKHKNNV